MSHTAPESEGYGLIADAPFRVDLTGGYTDISSFLRDMPTITVNYAVDIRVEIYTRPSANSQVEVVVEAPHGSSSRSAGTTANLRNGGGLGAFWAAALGLFGIHADVWVKSPLPLGLGLGSSGAVSVGMTVAGLALARVQDLERTSVPLLAGAIERSCGHRGGTQDQLSSYWGGLASYRFTPGASPVRRLLPLSDWLRRAVVIYSPSSMHDSSRLVEDVCSRFLRGERDTVTGVDRLCVAGADLEDTLASGLADPHDMGIHLREVVSAQRLLSPTIELGWQSSPIRSLIDQGYGVGKPLGGAGVGSAWVFIPDEGVDLSAHAKSLGLAVVGGMPSTVGSRVYR